jgi:hypothetical protein
MARIIQKESTAWWQGRRTIAPRVLTLPFQARLAHANRACRELRAAGYRVLTCYVPLDVPLGRYLGKIRLEVCGGAASDRPQAEGIEIVRSMGVPA